MHSFAVLIVLARSASELAVGTACGGECDSLQTSVQRSDTVVSLCLSATTSCGFTASSLWSTLSSPCCAWLTTRCGWTTKRTRGSVAVASHGSNIIGPVCSRAIQRDCQQTCQRTLITNVFSFAHNSLLFAHLGPVLWTHESMLTRNVSLAIKSN